jgi:hypothetical protein
VAEHSPAQAPLRRDAEHAICASLKALLDKAPGAREVLPHLAALQTALGLHGLAAIDGASTQVLQKLYSQLSSLPLEPDDQPLRELLARLVIALEDRAAEAKAVDPRSPMQVLMQVPVPPAFGTDSKLMVSEVSHSEFMAAYGDPPA